MQQYETMFIVSADLEDKARDKKIDEVKALITKRDGKILHETSWGKRKLAYPIKKEKNGFFVILNFEIEQEQLHEINEKLKFMDGVLRYLILKMPFVKESAKKLVAPKTEAELAAEAQKAAVEKLEKRVKSKAVATKKKEDEVEKASVTKEEKPVDPKALDKKLDEILQDDMNV